MKVKIGPYLKWWGPYQIADALFGNPDPNVYEESQLTWRHRWSERVGDWLAQDRNGDETWLYKLCEWIYNKRQRQVYVHIDNYDVWNMDSTLRLIIAPMLIKLKATKHGSPHVDDADVPEHLHRPPVHPGDELELDEHWHARWAWVMDELIWVFSHDEDAVQEEAYDHSEVDRSADLNTQIRQMKIDRKLIDAYNARRENAYRLFGKYYQALWD